MDLRQDELEIRGHAIECRINAEQQEAGFRPAPGRITAWRSPSGDGVRVDSHCYDGYLIPSFYDSLLAKVIVHGESRDAVLTRLRQALGDLLIEGVPTTLPFHLRLLGEPAFLDGRIHTRWVEKEFLLSWSRHPWEGTARDDPWPCWATWSLAPSGIPVPASACWTGQPVLTGAPALRRSGWTLTR